MTALAWEKRFRDAIWGMGALKRRCIATISRQVQILSLDFYYFELPISFRQLLPSKLELAVSPYVPPLSHLEGQ